jgi:hypothetical protein
VLQSSNFELRQVGARRVRLAVAHVNHEASVVELLELLPGEQPLDEGAGCLCMSALQPHMSRAASSQKNVFIIILLN